MVRAMLSAHYHGLLDGIRDPVYQTQLAFSISGKRLLCCVFFEVFSRKSYGTPSAGTTENE